MRMLSVVNDGMHLRAAYHLPTDGSMDIYHNSAISSSCQPPRQSTTPRLHITTRTGLMAASTRMVGEGAASIVDRSHVFMSSFTTSGFQDIFLFPGTFCLRHAGRLSAMYRREAGKMQMTKA